MTDLDKALKIIGPEYFARRASEVHAELAAEREKYAKLHEAWTTLATCEMDCAHEREKREKAEAEVKRLRVLLSDVFRRRVERLQDISHEDLMYDMDPCGCGECLECEVSDAIREES